jgi:hypothetical protein
MNCETVLGQQLPDRLLLKRANPQGLCASFLEGRRSTSSFLSEMVMEMIDVLYLT